MANIMQQVKLKNSTSRNGFDLSYRNAFTAKVGELLPVACYEVLPGDKFKLEQQHFTRTMPVNTAAFTRIREYYDWFFVPTNLLWNKFNSFVTQMVDNNQHALGINNRVVLSDTHPYFTLSQVNTYITNLNNNNSAASLNMFGYSRAQLSAKLLAYLNYGDFAASLVPNATADQNLARYRENVAYNPFPLLAYQKIYQDYFRNSQWEKAYAPSFNLDYMAGGASSSLQIPISDISVSNGSENMFDLRYANWHKDLFMGLLPNAQYGSAASIYISDPFKSIGIRTKEPSGQSTSADVNSYGYLVGQSQQKWQLLSDTGSPLFTEFSILQLRQTEAYQKWKEITQSQQQDYRSQVEAHFGVTPDKGLSEMCSWIDGSVSTLDISEVTNTNITSDNAADIAGKGVGVGESKTSFSSEVHGYLMCIYHAVPLLDYSFSGIERMNLKTKVTDYAIPEFDRTGMVAVPLVEMTNSGLNNNIQFNNLGYAPRYYDYKQKIDQVHGGFKRSLYSWVAPFNELYLMNYFENRSTASLDYQFFKVNPGTMNPIFAQDADSTVDSDQLLVNTAFDVKSVRNLDRNGLPY